MKMFSWPILETVVIEGFEYFMGTQDRRRAFGYGPNASACEIESAIRKLLDQEPFFGNLSNANNPRHENVMVISNWKLPARCCCSRR
jgi:hypothetical protein